MSGKTDWQEYFSQASRVAGEHIGGEHIGRDHIGRDHIGNEINTNPSYAGEAGSAIKPWYDPRGWNVKSWGIGEWGSIASITGVILWGVDQALPGGLRGPKRR